MRSRRGFTLIELMIVVAVILIIAAIAIPGMLNSKIAADEAAAIGSLRAINVAELSYQTTYPNKGFAPSLGVLGGGENCTPSAEAACLLDPDLSSGTKSGYTFAITAANSTNQANMSYVAGAAPLSFKHSGVRRFCSTEKNRIHRDENTQGSTTPPGQECVEFPAI